MYFQTSCLSKANNLVYLGNIMIYFIHQSMAEMCETYNHLRDQGLSHTEVVYQIVSRPLLVLP